MIVNPAVEKTLSADVEVAGIHNNRLATDGRVLNRVVAFHHVRGFSFLGMGASARYFSSSFSSVIESCESCSGPSTVDLKKKLMFRLRTTILQS